MVKKVIGVGIALGLLFGIVFRDKIQGYFSKDTRSVNKSEVKLLFKTEPSYSTLVATLIDKGVIKDGKNFGDYAEGIALIQTVLLEGSM